MIDPSAPPGTSPNDEDASDVAGILSHVAQLPNCDRLIYREPAALEELRGRLRQTAQGLERVVRHGTGEEAERARRAALACQLVLVVLDGAQRVQDKDPK